MDGKVLSRTLADSYNVSNVSHCVQVTIGIGPEKPCHHIGECAVELLHPCKVERWRCCLPEDPTKSELPDGL